MQQAENATNIDCEEHDMEAILTFACRERNLHQTETRETRDSVKDESSVKAKATNKEAATRNTQTWRDKAHPTK